MAGLTEIETQLSDAPPEAAAAVANEIAEDIIKATEYPVAPVPEPKTVEEVKSIFDELSADLDDNLCLEEPCRKKKSQSSLRTREPTRKAQWMRNSTGLNSLIMWQLQAPNK